MTRARESGNPLRARAPHLTSPGGAIRSWIVEPAGMLNEAAAGTFLTAELARYVMNDVEAEMKRAFPDAGKYVYVHDFSRVVGYEPRARRLLTDWGISRRHEIARVVVVTSPSHPLVRMGVRTAAIVLRAAGIEVEVADDAADVVRAYALRVAAT